MVVLQPFICLLNIVYYVYFIHFHQNGSFFLSAFLNVQLHLLMPQPLVLLKTGLTLTCESQQISLTQL